MRKNNLNQISNAWKKIDRAKKKSLKASINQSITDDARSGQFRRDGQLSFGAMQLFNIANSEYITFGVNTGGNTVAP